MGRPLRVNFADRLVHVMFHTLDLHRFNERDLEDFLWRLQRQVYRHKIKILAWTFMDNHVHLLIHFSEEQDGSCLVGTIESCLTKHYNDNHNRVGSLWRGRFKDVTVATVTHFWSVLFYVHLNKIKAGKIKSFEQDVYSSYKAYAYGIDDHVTTVSQDYLDLGDTPEERQQEFKLLLAEAWAAYQDKRTWERVAQGETVRVCNGRVDMGEVLALVERQDDILKKALAKIQSVAPVAKETLDAIDMALTKKKQEIRDLAKALAKRDIPAWVLKHFFAYEDYISDFVQNHRDRYRYSPCKAKQPA